MATTDVPTAAGSTTEERPIGFGRLKRKEDPRFVRGVGNYVDDVKLPGMLHGAVLRSPLAHARIVSIDTSAALQHPKVHAVITGKDLEGKSDNHIFDCVSGDRAATEKVFERADVVVEQEMLYPRVHPAPMETCG